MAQEHHGLPGQASLPPGAPRELAAGLALLGRAHDYALDSGADRWDFAVEIAQLYALGLTKTELRWLVIRGLAEQGEEVSAYGDEHRSFRPGRGLTFLPTTALVLTAAGAALARQVAAADPAGPARDGPSGSAGHGPHCCGLRPSWDESRRELRVGEALVKRFRVPARNQETILAVFQEEGWPAGIDDPLPADADVVPQLRLNSAIKRLNDNQLNRMIHFHGNGNGDGICWEIIRPAGAGAGER
jgi:hypothetical protein